MGRHFVLLSRLIFTDFFAFCAPTRAAGLAPKSKKVMKSVELC